MVDNVTNGTFEGGTVSGWNYGSIGTVPLLDVFASDFEPCAGNYSALIDALCYDGKAYFEQDVDFSNVDELSFISKLFVDALDEAPTFFEVWIGGILKHHLETRSSYSCQPMSINTSAINGIQSLRFLIWSEYQETVLFLDNISAIVSAPIPRFSPLWTLPIC